MKQCKKCGAELRDDYKICGMCGERVEDFSSAQENTEIGEEAAASPAFVPQAAPTDKAAALKAKAESLGKNIAKFFRNYVNNLKNFKTLGGKQRGKFILQTIAGLLVICILFGIGSGGSAGNCKKSSSSPTGREFDITLSEAVERYNKSVDDDDLGKGQMNAAYHVGGAFGFENFKKIVNEQDGMARYLSIMYTQSGFPLYSLSVWVNNENGNVVRADYSFAADYVLQNGLEDEAWFNVPSRWWIAITGLSAGEYEKHLKKAVEEEKVCWNDGIGYFVSNGNNTASFTFGAMDKDFIE